MNLNEQPSNVRVFICNHLFEKTRRISHVFHGEDGEISMICGMEDCKTDDAENCKIVGLGHMIDYEPDLKSLDNVSSNTAAWHDPNGNWVLTPMTLAKLQ